MMHPLIVNQQQIEAKNGSAPDLFEFEEFGFQECIVHNLEFRQDHLQPPLFGIARWRHIC